MKNNISRPIDPNRRIEIIDLIRGFALLGIIFDNVLYFSGYWFMPFSQLQQFSTYSLDNVLFQGIEIVIDGKFYRIFALLFGAGFYLQFFKNRENPAFIKTYRRRLFILMIIGIIHSLVWNGDILFMYALAGFIMILFRKVDIRKILWIAVVFFGFFFLTDLLGGILYQMGDHSFQPVGASNAHIGFPDMTPAEIIDISRNGSILQVFLLNIHHLVWKWMAKIPSGTFTTTIGLFLLGFYLTARKFFTVHIKSKKLLFLSLAIGVVCTFTARTAGGSMNRFPPDFSNTFLYKGMLNTGQLFLALFYMCLIARIIDTVRGKRILGYLIPVGRMALTNYLFQTFLQVILFYNIGFNLVGRTGVTYSVGIIVLILIFQIFMSNIWLKHFRFGPLEWLWRSLTYKKRIPLRKFF